VKDAVIAHIERIAVLSTDQSSILRFIEDNWLNGERIQPGGSFDSFAGDLTHVFKSHIPPGQEKKDDRKLILDPSTGAIVDSNCAQRNSVRIRSIRPSI